MHESNAVGLKREFCLPVASIKAGTGLTQKQYYTARNILSAVTPQLIASGYSKEYIGSISSLYFIFYAFGQLINGFVGERIKAKWMISIGLLGGGITNLIFSYVVADKAEAMIAYGMTGFFLSMIYGPMTKVVSENTETKHAVRCSLGYSENLIGIIHAVSSTFLLIFLSILRPAR